MYRTPPSLLLIIVLAGCTCGGDDTRVAVTDPGPTADPPHRTEETPAPQARSDEAPAPSAGQLRDWLRRLREARAASREGRLEDAYAMFEALVREQPERDRLRCEMGYVALRAGRLDDAEREIGRALGRWSTPPAPRDRRAYAMCLYNRGRAAEQRHDFDLAARMWGRSLAVRPNDTVRARLAALPPPAQEAGEPRDDGDAPATRDAMIARLAADLGAVTEAWTRDVASSRSGWTATHVRLTLPAEDDLGDECIEERIILSGPEPPVVLEEPEVSICEVVSYFADHVRLEGLELRAGPEGIGELVLARVVHTGRGDAPEGTGVEEYEEVTLHLCAEQLDWACAGVALSSTRSADCLGSGGCDDPSDPSDDPEDPRARLPAPYLRGYALAWAIDGDELVLSDASGGLTEVEPAPRTGRVPLAALFEP